MSVALLDRRTRATPRWERGLEDLVWFGAKQAVACTFPLAVFGMLAVTRVASVPGVARYDLLLVALLTVQVVLVAVGFETWADVAVAARFHALGLVLELFKTDPSIGSWSYPGAGLKLFGSVPLYSGFLYAAVASYTIAAWRLLRLRFTGYPRPAVAWGLAAAVYLNFFTHHVLPDLRWWLFGATLVAFGGARVHYRPRATERWMPVPLALVLIGGFVWLAENLSTFLGAWVYPHQVGADGASLAWQPVDLGKLSSWCLLVTVTFVIVGEALRRRHGLEDPPPRRVRSRGWHRLPATLRR